MRYFLTLACYGTHLHGDESGSVDRHRQRFGARTLEPDPGRMAAERRRMAQRPYELDNKRRAIVLQSLKEVCSYRGWNLLAAHVRSNHVHVVVESEVPSEKVMNDLKAYVSRALNQLEGEQVGRKRWARHGSTRWLWEDQDVPEAIRYVVEEQGQSMAVFLGDVP